MSLFTKATREKSRLRLALMGVAGSGKTFTALQIASAIGKRIAVIDTERGSASKYAGKGGFDFDVLELDDFSPQKYVHAINAAAAEGYDVVVVDSLSHAWMGPGGALDLVDKAAARERSGNTYTAWRNVTPQHNALVDAMLRCPAHVIATMRSKTEYVLEENDRGKKTPRKVGMAPVQRDGMEYEFDVIGDLSVDHQLVISKSRCSALAGGVYNLPDDRVAAALQAWLSDGIEPAPSAFKGLREDIRAATSIADLNAVGARIKAAFEARGISTEERTSLARVFAERKADLTPTEAHADADQGAA